MCNKKVVFRFKNSDLFLDVSVPHSTSPSQFFLDNYCTKIWFKYNINIEITTADHKNYIVKSTNELICINLGCGFGIGNIVIDFFFMANNLFVNLGATAPITFPTVVSSYFQILKI
jgi:hypothetical protein